MAFHDTLNLRQLLTPAQTTALQQPPPRGEGAPGPLMSGYTTTRT